MRGASSRAKRSISACMPWRERTSSTQASSSSGVHAERASYKRLSQRSNHARSSGRSESEEADAILELMRAMSSSCSARRAGRHDAASLRASPLGQKICGMIELRPTVVSQAESSQKTSAPAYHPALCCDFSAPKAQPGSSTKTTHRWGGHSCQQYGVTSPRAAGARRRRPGVLFEAGAVPPTLKRAKPPVAAATAGDRPTRVASLSVDATATVLRRAKLSGGPGPGDRPTAPVCSRVRRP